MDMEPVDYTKGAYAAYTTLQPQEKRRADELIAAFAASDGPLHPKLTNKIQKLNMTFLEAPIYSIRLNHKLRILVKKQEDQILIVDILNQDLFRRYFPLQVA